MTDIELARDWRRRRGISDGEMRSGSYIDELLQAFGKERAEAAEALVGELLAWLKYHHNGAETCEDEQCEGCALMRRAEELLNPRTLKVKSGPLPPFHVEDSD